MTFSLPARHRSSQVDNGLSNEDLFDRVKSGDGAAFEALFQDYYTALCGFVDSFVRSPEVSKELVQDIFTRIWEQRKAIELRGPLRAYLFGAARNHAMSFLRHERVGMKFVERAVSDPSLQPRSHRLGAADERVLQKELNEALLRAIEGLPEGQRTVILLRWRYHFTNAEIAQALGISEKGAETQVGRAMKSLRAGLAHFKEV